MIKRYNELPFLQ